MKKLILFLGCILINIGCLSAAVVPEYELEGSGTGSQGTYLLTVSVLTKNKNIDSKQLGKAAVHGVLFKGFSNKDLRQHQKPLAGSAAVEASHPEYFEGFFSDNGAYKNYVESVGGSRAVVKSGKQYKVSAKVIVNKEQLRKDLEQAGVIKGFNSIF
ncbi:MAG: hypothetical protein K2H86_01500 [Muribaculaceae bacterium]|nr:hypothetical protein [Muribaculaceae bacterium]